MRRSPATYGLLASLAPIALLPSTAAAQGVGELYWGLAGAAHFYSDNEINGADLEFDPGWAIAGQLGYIFGSVRAEAELEYNSADVDQIGNSNSNADLGVFRGTGGLYFDFIGFSQSNILPYVGGGFGFAALDFDGNNVNDDDTALTAHGEAGISFAAAASFDVTLAYRFEWYDTDVGGIDDDLTAHQVRFGLRWFAPGCC
ncbi:MAG: outer membrane protein [Geminicoccaceae bacterium]